MPCTGFYSGIKDVIGNVVQEIGVSEYPVKKWETLCFMVWE